VRGIYLSWRRKEQGFMTMVERVKELLENNISLRGNDNKLLRIIWEEDIAQILSQAEQQVITLNTFLALLEEGSLSNPKAVSRARRKVQQDNPYLRDNQIYDLRQDLAQKMRMYAATGNIEEMLR
tara:strand:- start:1242 stop:1616 length:375 start_codon:yes stop_codon:yes gene_type:complete